MKRLALTLLLIPLVAACGPSPSPTAAPSTPPAAVADRAPLAPDGTIDEAGLAHDSRDDTYRVPFGAVPAGTEVTLRLSATAGDLTEASVRVINRRPARSGLVPIEAVSRAVAAGEHLGQNRDPTRPVFARHGPPVAERCLSWNRQRNGRESSKFAVSFAVLASSPGGRDDELSLRRPGRAPAGKPDRPGNSPARQVEDPLGVLEPDEFAA